MIDYATFKAGDKVYCPILGSEIYTLRNSYLNSNNPKTTILTIGSTGVLFDSQGRMFGDKLPSIFNATYNNRKVLMMLYDIYLNVPETFSPSNIVSYLLTKQKYVPCYVTDNFEKHYDPDSLDEYEAIDLIYDYDINEALTYMGLFGSYEYAVPFDIVTGEIITEIDND